MRNGVSRRRSSIVAVACALGVLLTTGAPPVLRGQTPGSGTSATGASLSLPPSLRATVDQLADSARTMGVPTEPLYLKAAEGVLKGASDDRVTVVVRRLLAELRESRQGLGPNATSAELVAGASVVHAGLDAAALRRVLIARQHVPSDGSLVMPLVVLADLVARHVTPEIATTSVTALAERGAPDQEFASLRSIVEHEIGRGQSPDAATQARTAVILRTMPDAGRSERRPALLDPKSARP